jgi:hypothetical protein
MMRSVTDAKTRQSKERAAVTECNFFGKIKDDTADLVLNCDRQQWKISDLENLRTATGSRR